jgi:hypothetical protein
MKNILLIFVILFLTYFAFNGVYYSLKIKNEYSLDKKAFVEYYVQNENQKRMIATEYVYSAQLAGYMIETLNSDYRRFWMPKNKCIVKDESKYEY